MRDGGQHDSKLWMKSTGKKEETHCGYTVDPAQFSCRNCQRMNFAALLMSGPPVYEGVSKPVHREGVSGEPTKY